MKIARLVALLLALTGLPSAASAQGKPAPKDALLYFVWPQNGATIKGGFWCRFGLRNMGVTHAGDNFKFDLRATKRLNLFTQTAKNRWVARLQPHDCAASAGMPDHQSVDLLLRMVMVAIPLPHADFLCRRGDQRQDFRCYKIIMQHRVRGA